jgi:predicted signal transduction protein with EAL and GGDEF domain/FixJ family two-component response regulator
MDRRELLRMNRLYAMLSQINHVIVRAHDPYELYSAACRIAIESGGFCQAWIGLIDPVSRLVQPVARAGAVVEELDEYPISAADAGDSNSPTGRAIREGKVRIVNGTGEAEGMDDWSGRFDRCWLGSIAAVPLRLEGEVIGALTLASEESGFFRHLETHLLEEVAGDISYALESMRGEEKRLAAESKMRFLAYYDSYTGLPGRELFNERLTQACRDMGHRMLGVLVANLRNYHGVLQTLGEAGGRNIARVVTERLESIEPPLFVARVSEAEFAILLEDQDGPHTVEDAAWRIHSALAQAVRVEDQEVILSPFIGIALHPKDGAPDELLQRAMAAADKMPGDASGYCRFFWADLETHSRHQLSMESALHRAVERGEFVLHYQPQLDLRSGRMIGAEALVRWQRPGHGLVPPQEFISLLEDNGLISVVGEWILHEACRRGREWQDGEHPLRIAVNLSARQFSGGDIRATVKKALDATGLDPGLLELELTESIVLLDAEAVIRTLRELSSDGVNLALDDFGTGFSSLSYLQRLPVKRLKIDRGFVNEITSNPGSAAIVRAIVGMAHSLGLSVIAEGVETEGQLGFLRALCCEEMQGYLFSPPLPADRFVELMHEGRGLQPLVGTEKRERVLLVVDDEPNMLAAIKRAMRRVDMRVLTTTSVYEGFDILATNPVGVVISDHRMPEMTGTEFLRRVKELHPGVVRIVLTGYTEVSAIIDAVNRGAVYKFLTKPWDDELLRENIEEAFRIHEMTWENRELTRKLNARRDPSPSTD